MSFDHKAFIFDYIQFESELKNILETALETNKITDLEDFIINNISFLRNPDDGEFLFKNWIEMLQYKDSHGYGDIALTKFYNPLEDIGLGCDWIEIESFFPNKINMLGFPIGKSDNYFDLGKMGSYFQNLDMVIQNKEIINKLIKDNQNHTELLEPVLDILNTAISANKGLYIYF